MITHLRSIAISAEDPADLLPFYEDTWGLQRVGTTETGEVRLRGRGAEHHLMSLVPGDGHSLERISLGAAGPAEVDALAQRLRERGTEVLTGPGAVDGDPETGYAITFRDPEGRLVEVSAEVVAHDGDTERPFGPDRLSHIVLNSTAMEASQAFWTDVLGFSVSDEYEDGQMVFLRCNPQHHCVVLAPGEWTSLNHVAFEVATAEEVMRSLGRMKKAGFDTIWGPGRHGPGGNVFCYFVDPVGNVIEYTAELLEVGDDWQPQVWARNAENADVWGTSGGINPSVVAAMANPPAGARA